MAPLPISTPFTKCVCVKTDTGKLVAFLQHERFNNTRLAFGSSCTVFKFNSANPKKFEKRSFLTEYRQDFYENENQRKTVVKRQVCKQEVI